MGNFKWLKRKSIFFVCFVMIITFIGLSGISSAKSKTMELKVVTYLSPRYGDGFYCAGRMVDYINQYGKSRGISAKLYHSQTVYKSKEMLPALISGNIDIGVFMGPYVEGTLPIFGASDLPFIWDDVYTQREGVRKGSPIFNLVAKECAKKNLQLLAMASSMPEEILSRKPLMKIEDFKGMKIRVAGAVYAKALESIGAVPISMPSSETYTSLQRGVVDAVMGGDITFRARKLYEVAKYQINLRAFQFDWPVLMNMGSFSRLSEEQKKVVWNAAEHYRHDFSTGESLGSGYLQLRNLLEKNYGVDQRYLSKSERAELKKMMLGPTSKWWKKRIGQEVGDRALKAIEESKNWRKSKFGYLELYPLKY